MVYFGSLGLIFLTISLIMINPNAGILLLQFIKPLTDAAWRHGLFGIRIPEIIGAVVPVVVLFKILTSKDKRLFEMPLTWLWAIYLFINLISGGMILLSGKYLSSLENILLILNGFLGYFMFQFYIRDDVWFRRLLIVLILAGIFPMLTSFYQSTTGTVWQLRHGSGGLIRSVGAYHNVMVIRLYAFVTIASLLLYWSYFSNQGILKKTFMLLYGFLCVFVIFKAYSKAGFVILGLWAIIWCVMNRKYTFLFIFFTLLLIINFSYHNKIFTDISTTFYKERAAIEGIGDAKYVLAGRPVVWGYYLEKWRNLRTLNKVFGAGETAGSAHNDYLRVLICNGIFGLFIYIILLMVIGFKVIMNLISKKTPLTIVAVMLFLMWMVDSIGLTPGIYPGYQWLTWGFIGLSLKGIEGIDGLTASK